MMQMLAPFKFIYISPTKIYIPSKPNIQPAATGWPPDPSRTVNPSNAPTHTSVPPPAPSMLRNSSGPNHIQPDPPTWGGGGGEGSS